MKRRPKLKGCVSGCGSIEGEFQGGSIDMVTAEEVEGYKGEDGRGFGRCGIGFPDYLIDEIYFIAKPPPEFVISDLTSIRLRDAPPR